MPQTPSDTYSTAFKYWKTVRTRLEHTIQDYAEACVTLETALAKPPPAPLNCLREKAYADLGLELPSLPSLEQALQSSRSSLNLARNSSYSLVPVNSLPSEILHMIFSLANQKWLSEDYIYVGNLEEASVTTLSSVCSSWRSLMLQSGEFWSQLQFTLVGPSSTPHLKQATLWAKRSGDGPLDICVSEGETEYEQETTISDWDINRAILSLTPLMPRVRRLEIHAPSLFSRHLIHRLVACWVQNGTIGMASGFEVYVGEEFDPVILPDDRLPLGTFHAFFGSLKSLRLENTVMNLRSLACTGLIELHLESIQGWSLTISEIAVILRANPRLRSVALVDISIASSSDPMPHPAALNYLETLTLEEESPSHLWEVLLVVTSSSSAVRLSLTLASDPKCVSAVHLFFSRCKVTMLCLRADSLKDSVISAILVPMPHLQTLVLQYLTLVGETLRSFTDNRSSVPHPPILWPNLRTMTLYYCDLTRHSITQLGTLLQPSQKLLVANIQNEPESYISAELRNEEQEDFMRRGVELVWLEDAGDPTMRWMFVFT